MSQARFALGAAPGRRGEAGGIQRPQPPNKGLAAGAGLSLNVGIDLDSTSGSGAVQQLEATAVGEATQTAMAPGLSVTRNQEMGHELFGTLVGGPVSENTMQSRLETTAYSTGSATRKGHTYGGSANGTGAQHGSGNGLNMGDESVTMLFGGGGGGSTIVSDAGEAAFLAMAMGGEDDTTEDATAGAAPIQGAGNSSDEDDIWGPKRPQREPSDDAGDDSTAVLGGAAPAIFHLPPASTSEETGAQGLSAPAAGATAEDVAWGRKPPSALALPAPGGGQAGSLGAALGFALDVKNVNKAAVAATDDDDSDEGLLAGWARGDEVAVPPPESKPATGSGGTGGMPKLGLSFNTAAVNAAAVAGADDDDSDEGLLAGWARGEAPGLGQGAADADDVSDALIGFTPGAAFEEEEDDAVDAAVAAGFGEDKYDMGEGGSVHLGGMHISERGLHDQDGNSVDPSTTFKNTSVRVDVLGAGASGRVFKTIHVPSLTVVAVKSIPMYDVNKRHRLEEEFKALYHNMTSMKRMKRTAETHTAGLLHAPGQAMPAAEGNTDANVTLEQVAPCPFITSFYDVFTDLAEGTMNFVMEYMDAGSLDDFMAVGPCRSESTLANISYRILKGLQFLHAKHCIHRDLKPENVLLNHYGHVKLADFGILREMTSSDEMVSTFIGTLFYMSPERVAGKPYSFASDIWAFGMTVLTVALGHFPYGEKCAYFELMNKLQEEPAPVLPEAHFSQEARDFFGSVLMKDPALRPSADELLRHPWLQQQKAAQRAHQQEFGLIPPPPPKDTEVPEQTMLDVDTMVRTVQLYRMAQAKRRKRFKLRQVHPSRIVWLSQQTQIPLHIIQYKFKQTTRVINAALAKKRAALTASRAVSMGDASERSVGFR